MPQQQTVDGVIYERTPEGKYKVVGYADAPAAPSTYVTKQADPRRPYEAPLAAADLEAKRRAAARDAALLPAQVRAAQAEAAIRERELAQGVQTKGLSPEVRANALAQYESAAQIEAAIAELEALGKKGPLATNGIVGLSDYLPLEANSNFNSRANGLRGIVRNALGLTGGENNTATESRINLGAYIPQAGDYNAVIIQKLKTLQGLADNARKTASATLGGVPDANGNVVPIKPAQQNQKRQEATPPVAPAGGGLPGGTGQANFTSGGYDSVYDPALAGGAARISAMLKSGAPDDAIRAYAQNFNALPASVEANLKFRREHPKYAGDYDTGSLAFKQVPRTPLGQVLGQVAQTPFGAGAMNAGNAATFNNLDSLVALGGGNATRARASLDAVSAQNPVASLVGSALGGATAAGGLQAGLGAAGLGGRAALIGSDIGYGGLSGAGGADNPDRLGGGLTGLVAGGAGGVVGRNLARGTGSALTGVTRAPVGYLDRQGVPLTIGQTLGGVAKGVEDRLAGFPLIGDAINARRREGFQGFAEASRRQALEPIGAVPGPETGAEAIPAMRGQVGQAYDNALGGVRVTADQPFVAGMTPILQVARQLPDPMASNLDYTLRTRVGNSFGNAGELDGNGFQQSIRGLRQDTAAVRNLPYGNDFANGTRATEAQLEGLLNRQAPGVVPAYQAANAANRRVSVIRDATTAARGGTGTGENYLYTPSQLNNAAVANARRFGGTQGTPQQPFFDLGNAGQEVLPSRVPDSGTAGREAVAFGLGTLGLGAAGGGAGYATGDTGTGAATGVGLAGLGAGIYSRTGQRLIARALLDRPDTLRALGAQIYDNPRIPGMFGAALGVGAQPLLLGSGQ